MSYDVIPFWTSHSHTYHIFRILIVQNILIDSNLNYIYSFNFLNLMEKVLLWAAFAHSMNCMMKQTSIIIDRVLQFNISFLHDRQLEERYHFGLFLV